MDNHYIKSILILLVGVFLYGTDRDICEIPVENQESWNLVGLPVYVSDDTYQSVFPGSIENTLYSFSDGIYTQENELILGRGYWLKFSEYQSDTLIGECIDDFTVSLVEGWNLISVVSHPVSVDDIIDTDGIIIDGTVFGFSGGYYEPTILEMGKGYWVRCYNEGEIIIPEITVTDIDGNVYETIAIGEQVWMKENLKVTHYNNGYAITHITNEEHWGSMDEGQYGVYDDEPTNANIYGNIYNWAVIGDIRGICPVDWHVPSDDEYTVLTDFLGGESVAGGKMKEAGLEHWNYDSDQISLEATNESGFTGLPAGHRNTNSGDYIYMGFYGYFWSSTENGSDLAWRRYLFHYSSGVARDTFGKPNGFSIRCLED